MNKTTQKRSSLCAKMFNTGGGRFQQLALTARELGIAIHPMTQILEEEGTPSFYKVLGEDAHIPQFVLRVGYLDRYLVATGLRRPVAWFVYS